MIALLIAWVATCAGLFTIGNALDKMLTADAKSAFAKKIAIAVTPDPVRWMRAMSSAFVTLFDRVYGWRRSVINKTLWQVIIFCYAVFLIARLILWLFALIVPSTELILATSIYVAIGAILFLRASRSFTVLTDVDEHGIPAASLLNRAFIVPLVYGMVMLGMIVLGVFIVFSRMGSSPRVAIGLSIGIAIALPLLVLVAIVPDRVHYVNPVRAILSSFAFMLILALVVPDAARSFIDLVAAGNWLLLSFVAFNIFADAISLVETRWILRTSRTAGVLRILGLLVLDLVLSGVIYLVLPLIANQDLRVLMDALRFRGSMPWMGILFWTTFSTSAFFYLFVISVLTRKLLTPITRLLPKWIDVENHPAGTVACAMGAVCTVAFAILATLRAF